MSSSEHTLQLKRPGQPAASKLRLIREYTAQLPAVFFSELLPVAFIGGVDKFFYSHRTERIRIVWIHIIADSKISPGFFTRRQQPVVRSSLRSSGVPADDPFRWNILKWSLFTDQPFLLIVQPFGGNLPVCKTAGPTVLVIEPGVHPQPAAFLNRSADGLHPFFAHVRRLQPAPGMHEEAANSRPVHLFNLPLQLLFLQPVIPGPERNGAVCGRRVLQGIPRVQYPVRH
ncbi:hypothetical protein D3C76_261850 [compost metagenome]